MWKLMFFIIGGLLISEEFLFTAAEPSWTSLRVTWGLNLFSSRTFAKLPRSEDKARARGYSKINAECSDGKFLGNRYSNGAIPDVVLIYDVKGYIAGMQFGLPKRDAEEKTNFTEYSFSTSPVYQLDTVGGEEIYFVTAYFVDPSIICNEGRSKQEYEEQGTGTGLYMQNGTNPLLDTVHIPLYEQGMNVTNWVRGRCFPTMGIHYWYDFSEDMSCRNAFPITAIYNRGKLTSFAFVSFGVYEYSTKFEHPPESTLSRFLPEPLPRCIINEYENGGGFTTMHVFFSVRPWNIIC